MGMVAFGDDFILNFKTKMSAYTEKGSSFNDQTAIDQFIDFFCAFYERLIYNAEMYIRESTNDYNGTAQPSIRSFTYIPGINTNTETNAVAYSYGCQDTIAAFNSQMDQQRNILNNYIKNGLRGYYKNSSGWTNTTVPSDYNINEPDRGGNNDYYNYAMPRNNDGSRNSSNAASCYLPPINNINYLVYENPGESPFYNTYCFGSDFPYLPGWALQDRFNGGSYNEYYVNAISAGIDCLGFAMRCAEYADIPINNRPVSPYYGSSSVTWAYQLPEYYPDGNWQNIGETSRQRRVFVRQDNYNATLIASSSNTSHLSAVYPGSICYFEFTDPQGNIIQHTAIVRNVSFSEGIRTLTLSNLDRISLIEATWNGDKTWAKVNKDGRTLSLYSTALIWEINKPDQ